MRTRCAFKLTTKPRRSTGWQQIAFVCRPWDDVSAACGNPAARRWHFPEAWRARCLDRSLPGRRSAADQTAVVTLECGKARIIGPQAQHPTPGVAHHAGGLVDHLLHHRLDAPPLGLVAHRRILAMQRMLTDQAQQVHRHSRRPLQLRADQIVGAELARGQSLQTHVALKLRVKLLVRAMLGIQPNDPSGIDVHGQAGGPALQHVLGQQQRLAMLVDSALGQTIDAPHGLLPGIDTINLHKLLPHAQALALAGMTPHGVGVPHLLCGMRSTGALRGQRRHLREVPRWPSKSLLPWHNRAK